MVKEMEKKRILPAAGSSRQHAWMREEAGRKPFVGGINAAVQSGGGKKISTPLTFFPSDPWDPESSDGMDPLVPSRF